MHVRTKSLLIFVGLTSAIVALTAATRAVVERKEHQGAQQVQRAAVSVTTSVAAQERMPIVGGQYKLKPGVKIVEESAAGQSKSQ